MKNFIANIPFMISVPFQFIAKASAYVVMKLVVVGGTIHIKFKTPLGLRLLEAKKMVEETDKNLKDIQILAKKLAEKRQQSDSTLANIISNGRKNGPTFH